MKSFGPKNFQIPCMDQKVPFWQFFRQGQDGHALLVRPSRIPHRISKIIFAMGADEFLAMELERPHFLKVQSGKITVWMTSFTQLHLPTPPMHGALCVLVVAIRNSFSFSLFFASLPHLPQKVLNSFLKEHFCSEYTTPLFESFYLFSYYL